MEIVQVIENEVLQLHINGQLDANSSIQLDDIIKEALKQQRTRILIDCKELSYISSAGLGVFISHLDDVNGSGGRFVFFGMNESVLNIFKILGLHTVLEIVENEREAKMLMNEG